MEYSIYMQPMPRGRAATADAVAEVLDPLASLIEEERRKLSFSPTLRGWCYVMEGLQVITKGEFDNLTSRITMCRLRGFLPLDITAEDETRAASGGCWKSQPLSSLVRSEIEGVRYLYRSTVIEEHTGVHVELVVEKLDLVGLLDPLARKYGIPITCSRGWSDIHARANILRRCSEYNMPSVILLFGDHDVGGLNITKSFKANLEAVFPATGLAAMPDLRLDRIGLNEDDIERLGLVWIDGLETSSGGDLADPKHKQHHNADVQDYLRKYGARKCEANALMRAPQAALDILQVALDKYVKREDLRAYQQQVAADRVEADAAIDRVVSLMEADQ